MDVMVCVAWLLQVEDGVVTEIPLELMVNAPIWRQESWLAKGHKILPEPAAIEVEGEVVLPPMKAEESCIMNLRPD